MYAPMVKRQRSGSMSLSHTMQEIGIEDLSELLSTLGSASEDEDDNPNGAGDSFPPPREADGATVRQRGIIKNQHHF